jgi:hypothetical protein
VVTSLTSKRADLLHHLGEVTLGPGGEIKRHALGRSWRVNSDMAWLINAKFAEVNPDDEDLDLKGFRPTEAGREWLATHDTDGGF